MAKAYFRKELVSRKVHYKNGTPVPFEALGEGYGVLVLENEANIEDLRSYAVKGVGGVTEIDAEGYEETKKKFGLKSSEKPHPAKRDKSPRVFHPEDLGKPLLQPNAPPVPGPGNAASAAGTAPATTAAEPVVLQGLDGINIPANVQKDLDDGKLPSAASGGRKINLNVGKPKDPNQAPPPPEPPKK